MECHTLSFFARAKTRRNVSRVNVDYNDDTQARSTICKWITEFRTSMEDGERPSRPSEIGDQIVEKLKSIVAEDPRITKQRFSERLNISCRSMHNMLKEIGLRKLSSRFVPCFQYWHVISKTGLLFEKC